MRRAATPTHTFTLPDDVRVETVSKALISYSQCGKNILEKTLQDLAINTETNSFLLTLTQEEANKFAPGKALIQVKVKVGSAVLESQMIWLEVKPVLNSEVI